MQDWIRLEPPLQLCRPLLGAVSFTALADAIANAPECRVKEAILSGAWSSMQATIARDAA